MKEVTVIVSKCVPDSRFSGTGGYSVYGDRLLDTRVASVEAGKALGEPHCIKGMSVLVRPNYNETDADGTFYREWRSFNGEPFREIRFGI